MMKPVTLSALALIAATPAAWATTVTQFDGVTAGRAKFEATVTGTGAVVKNDTWGYFPSGTSVDFGDYVLTANDGSWLSPASYGSLSGQTANIDPELDPGTTEPAGGRADPLSYKNSGITLTFDNAVNAIGFEVGDWATCCNNPVTELFISFDDGAPIRVASATSLTEGLFPSQSYPDSIVNEIFVGATDDTGQFTRVSFWGNGLGEYLVFGGRVSYALVDKGSLPPEPVPLPAAGGMLVAGLGALAAIRRRR